MSTLGAQYKAGEARVARGEARYPTGRHQFKAHNEPSTVIGPAVLRASFEAVVAKAKADFAAGIAANLAGSEFLRVCSYVPRTEAFYLVVERTYGIRQPEERIHIIADSYALQQAVEQVWNPFLAWVTEQGLDLTMGAYVNEAGVREYMVLEVWALDDEPDD